MYVCMYVCMYIYIYIYIERERDLYVCIYIYTYIHTYTYMIYNYPNRGRTLTDAEGAADGGVDLGAAWMWPELGGNHIQAKSCLGTKVTWIGNSRKSPNKLPI